MTHCFCLVSSILCSLIFYGAQVHASNEPYFENSTTIETETEESLCIVCFDKQKNDDELYIAWTEEEWREMAANKVDLHFPDCHGSEICSGCLIKIVCSKGECPTCKRKPKSPLKRESAISTDQQSEASEHQTHDSPVPRPKGYSVISSSTSSASSGSSIASVSNNSRPISRTPSSHRSNHYRGRGVSRRISYVTRASSRAGSRSRSARSTTIGIFNCFRSQKENRNRNQNGNKHRLSYLLPCIFGSSE